MLLFRQRLRKARARRRGVTSLEYILLSLIVGFAALGGAQGMAPSLGNVFSNLSTAMAPAGAPDAWPPGHRG
ncbi:MAG: hypothetical protein KGJ41_18880 [Rhodospirillales bacterium]|nr:hypothetical protein [Rhodospirillales bacterium]MDE2201075.1 hypothetical protein [Rhodospirillales bacterium]MDE2575222.1 hypothetical protein [Rhodospirillales bacterium]